MMLMALRDPRIRHGKIQHVGLVSNFHVRFCQSFRFQVRICNVKLVVKRHELDQSLHGIQARLQFSNLLAQFVFDELDCDARNQVKLTSFRILVRFYDLGKLAAFLQDRQPGFRVRGNSCFFFTFTGGAILAIFGTSR